MKDLVESVVKNDNCVGCGLCSNLFGNCYGMQLSEKGFYRPQKLKENKEENLNEEFKKLCPGIIRRQILPNDENISIWGKYERMLTTFSSDEDIRYKAATGGSLTATLLYLLNSKIVDGVLQVKANKKQAYIAQYDISTTKEEIIECLGSRYEPCFMFAKLNAIKSFEGKLAVVGKPCDIATLRRYAEQYNLNDKIYCYITFLCGGTPSINATLDILNENGIKKDEITDLKYRGEGWPGYFKANSGKDELIKVSYVDSWARKLSKKIQNACKICTDGIGEMADIVFGDAWNLDENGKINFEESDGVNITITRNKLGNEIIDNAIKNKYLTVKNEVLEEDILNKMQPFQAMHRKMVYYKILGKQITLKKVPYYSKKVFKRYSKNENIVKKIKTILSSAKRELKGE